MTDKLTLYNLSLHHLGQRKLHALTEAVESRRVLDDIWDQTISECLDEGLWNFALRAIQIDASTTITPQFGWAYAFTQPADWKRTILVSTVETFTPPLLDYQEESGYWYCDWTPIFVRYISSDNLYGMNLGRWPAHFAAFVGLKLAEYSCRRITGSNDLLQGPDGISRRCYKAKIKAKSNDAMNDPPGQLPTGTWARSRRGFLRGLPAPGGTGFDD